MAILEVHNLKKIYTTRFGGNQVQALADLNFSVEKGEYVAIMGESGSGKTTLLNIIMGVEKTDKGIVEFVNDNGQSVKPGFSAVFQDCRLIEHLSPVINVKMVLKKNKKNSAKDVAFAVKSELLKLLDKEALDKPCSE